MPLDEPSSGPKIRDPDCMVGAVPPADFGGERHLLRNGPPL